MSIENNSLPDEEHLATSGSESVEGLEAQGTVGNRVTMETMMNRRRSRLIYKAKPSILALYPCIVAALILLVLMWVTGNPLFFLLLVVPGAAGWMMFSSQQLEFTNKRLSAATGVLRKESIEISLARVTKVEVESDKMGSILGYGTVILDGDGISPIKVPRIASPQKFQKAYETFIDEIRTAKGQRME